MITRAEYIWLDGEQPTQHLRSKTRVLDLDPTKASIKDFPEWSFDGSSTYQSTGDNSDLILNPVNFCIDPIRNNGSFLVLCEVNNADSTPHKTNSRSKLRELLTLCEKDYQPLIGFEQEYTLFAGRTPLGWPENGYPRSQGPFYCGIGSDRVFGREIAEAHTKACIEAGLAIFGINAEVMPGQWEYQIGYRGFANDKFNILDFSDQLWFSRWLLHRIAEDYNVTVSFDNKPIKGDWNGAGCHTNFSTKQMRDAKTGMTAIDSAIESLKEKHLEHIKVYGAGLEERLTGLHETCKIDEFRSGVADRGASIRIPQQVKKKGYGYIEDRRPGANCCPYTVSTKLITTICRIDKTKLCNKDSEGKVA